MQIFDLINAATGNQGLEQLGRQFGLSEAQTSAAAGQLLPAILGGIKKQAQGGSGLDSVLQQLGGGTQAYADDVRTLATPEATDAGNNILGQIFGSKDVSRTVASQAAQSTGLSPDLLKKLLPILAALATGALARQGAGQAQPDSGGGLAGLVTGALGSLLGGKSGTSTGSGGLGGLAAMLDMDGDGNPLDDLLSMAGKALR